MMPLIEKVMILKGSEFFRNFPGSDLAGVAALADVRHAEAGETVLVVEDEPVVRALILEVLDDLGYQALEAVDGPSGLKILETKQRIDLLVSDVGLPGLNGRQLADHARLGSSSLRSTAAMPSSRRSSRSSRSISCFARAVTCTRVGRFSAWSAPSTVWSVAFFVGA